MDRWYNLPDSETSSDLRCARCIIVETKGSTPRKVGAKMIVFENGEIKGTIGGGNLEKKVIENAIAQIEAAEPKLYKHDLLHQHNMCCGGTVLIYIEPIMTTNKLYIFGAGHTGAALADYASHMDFEIFVIDDRPEYLNNIESESVNKIEMDHKKVLSSLPFDKNTYVVIMTYEHSHDRDILSHTIKQPNAYIGMIGSQRKIELTKKMFLEGKIGTKEELDAVDMPMGLNIDAEGPNEIAVSILAKLIEVKNGK
jgi:xanthine dehydrogenase accessory factor